MKVLLFGSNPEDAQTLRIEEEITELQQVFSRVSSDRVEFKTFPKILFEDISDAIAQAKPDIVHFVAHGETDGLWISKRGDPIKLTADSFLDAIRDYRPKLIYLNACNSSAIAKAVAKSVPFAIGTTAKIQNDAAIKSATAFYRGLLRGQSVQAAYNTARAVTLTLNQTNAVDMTLFVRRGENSRKEILYSTPRLIAQFVDHDFVSDDGLYNFEIGLSGAGLFTWQVVFCTDDESFIGPRRALASQLCFVARTNPIKGEVWCDEVFVDIEGDFRLYALAITPSGDCYSIAGTLCEALTNFYEAHLTEKTGSKFPKELTQALNHLSDNNGARLFTKTSALEPFFAKARKSTPAKRLAGAKSLSKKGRRTPGKPKKKSISRRGGEENRMQGP
jgi:hypothetical protein